MVYLVERMLDLLRTSLADPAQLRMQNLLKAASNSPTPARPAGDHRRLPVGAEPGDGDGRYDGCAASSRRKADAESRRHRGQLLPPPGRWRRTPESTWTSSGLHGLDGRERGAPTGKAQLRLSRRPRARATRPCSGVDRVRGSRLPPATPRSTTTRRSGWAPTGRGPRRSPVRRPWSSRADPRQGPGDHGDRVASAVPLTWSGSRAAGYVRATLLRARPSRRSRGSACTLSCPGGRGASRRVRGLRPAELDLPVGAYICVVDVDRGTGQVVVRRFIAVSHPGRGSTR